MQIRLKSCLFPNWINIFLLWNKQTHCGIRTFPGKIKFFFFHSKNRHKWNSECQILKTSRFNLRRVQETLQHFSVKTTYIKHCLWSRCKQMVSFHEPFIGYFLHNSVFMTFSKYQSHIKCNQCGFHKNRLKTDK